MITATAPAGRWLGLAVGGLDITTFHAFSSWGDRLRSWLPAATDALTHAVLKAVRVTAPGSPADRLDWAEIEAGLPHPAGGAARIAGYIRLSCDMEEQSLKIQRDQILRYAQQHGWQIDHFYTDDALSGRSNNRPDLRRLRHDVVAGLVDVIVVDRIDRLYRNLLGLLRFVKLLGDHDVLLISVSEGMDFQTQWGKLTLELLHNSSIGAKLPGAQ